MMQTQPIGKSKLQSTRLAFGNMRSVGGWDPNKVTKEQFEHAVQCHVAAFEAGINHFDTADIYCRGKCEQALGETLRRHRGMREKIIITTKVGIRFGGDPTSDAPFRYDFSAEHILAGCERSLKNLGIDTIDLYLLHRPDMLMQPMEIAEAFEKLQSSGKVRYFGVSNFKPSLVTMLQKFLPMPLIANQVHVHPARLDTLYDGTMDQCIELGITPQAWSPMAGGMLGSGGKIKDEDPRREGLHALIKTLDEIAAEHNSTRDNIVLAWLMMHPAKIMPVLGTANLDRIREQSKADDIRLTREQWYKIFIAGRMKKLP